MTRKLLVGVIAAGALAVTAGTAFALSADDGPTPRATTVPTSFTDPTSTTSETTTSTSTSTSTSTFAPIATTESTPSTAPTQSGAELSADDAARLVQGRLGGTVHEVEREVEHGRLEWKVEITASDGKTYDIRVDAQNGNVTRIEPEDSDDRGGRHGGDDDDHGDDHDDDDGDRGRHGGGDDD